VTAATDIRWQLSVATPEDAERILGVRPSERARLVQLRVEVSGLPSGAEHVQLGAALVASDGHRRPLASEVVPPGGGDLFPVPEAMQPLPAPPRPARVTYIDEHPLPELQYTEAQRRVSPGVVPDILQMVSLGFIRPRTRTRTVAILTPASRRVLNRYWEQHREREAVHRAAQDAVMAAYEARAAAVREDNSRRAELRVQLNERIESLSLPNHWSCLDRPMGVGESCEGWVLMESSRLDVRRLALSSTLAMQGAEPACTIRLAGDYEGPFDFGTRSELDVEAGVHASTTH
jgi:hypothetical protein